MNTLVTDLTAFQLLLIVVAGNCWFYGFLYAFRKLINDPNEQTLWRKATTWFFAFLGLGLPFGLVMYGM